MPAPPAPFREISPHTVELRERSGCLAVLFGVPFFLAGIFLALQVTGLSHYEIEPSNQWTHLLLGLASLVFLSFGSVMLFARRSLTLDLSTRSLVRQQGLLVPWHRDSRQVSEFSGVVIAYDSGDSDSPAQYPVRLRAIYGKDFQITKPVSYGESLRQAEYLSRLLSLPLIDTTTDHAAVIAPDRVGEALRDRLLPSALETERVERPPGLRSEVSENGGNVTIVISGGKSMAAVFAVSSAAVGLLIAVPIARRILSPAGPRGIEFPILMGFVLFLTVPATAWCVKLIAARRARTAVKASSKGLVIERRGLWRTRTTEVPAADIFDVDYSTIESTLKSVRTGFTSAAPTAETLLRAQRLLTVLGPLLPNQGIIVKSNQGLIRFGEGLPVAELRYLNWVLKKTLAGR